MTSSGEVFPTTGTTATASGHTGLAWQNPTAIYSDNATGSTDTTNTSYITSTSFDAGIHSYVLYGRAFDFSTIPDNVTINGVTCRINAWGDGDSQMELAQLLTTGAALTGTNQLSSPANLPNMGTGNVVTVGGTADNWGLDLTPSWVKNSSFGVGIGSVATAANARVWVDCVSLEITYTSPDVNIDGTESATFTFYGQDSSWQANANVGTTENAAVAVAAQDADVVVDQPAFAEVAAWSCDGQDASVDIPVVQIDSPALEISNFGTFVGIGPSDIINNVTVRINEFVSSASDMGAPTFELWDGASAQIGATQTGTATTDADNIDLAVFTGVTYSQLATLRVRVYAHSTSTPTPAAIQYVDYASLTVNYTAVAVEAADAENASWSIDGQDASVSVSASPQAECAAFTIVGQDLTATTSANLPDQGAALTWAAQDASVIASANVSADYASVTFENVDASAVTATNNPPAQVAAWTANGNDVTITTSANAGIENASLTVAGEDGTVTASASLPAECAAWTLSGQDVTATASGNIVAEVATWSLDGKNASVSTSAGANTQTDVAALLFEAQDGSARTSANLPAECATWQLAGQTATAAPVSNATDTTGAALTFAAQDVTAKTSANTPAECATWQLEAQTASVITGAIPAAQNAAVGLTAQDASITASSAATPSEAAWSLLGNDATVSVSAAPAAENALWTLAAQNITAQVVSYATDTAGAAINFAAQDITAKTSANIPAQCAAWSVDGQDAVVQTGIVAPAENATWSIDGQNATVAVVNPLPAQCADWSIDGQDAALGISANPQAGVALLTINGQDGSVDTIFGKAAYVQCATLTFEAWYLRTFSLGQLFARADTESAVTAVSEQAGGVLTAASTAGGPD